MNRILILFFICAFFLSCRELEDPISTKSEPVFYLKGKLNSDSIRFFAGDSAYYHFTTHELDRQKIYEFSSEFKQTNCVNCNDKIKVTIRAHEKSPNQTIDIFDALGFGTYNYLENVAQPFYRVIKFKPDTSLIQLGSTINFNWDFGDGNISTEALPVHYYRDDGIYNVRLDYNNGACAGSVSKELTIQLDTIHPVCKADFNYFIANPTEVLFIGGDTVYNGQYLWDFGDGHTSTDPITTHTYAELKPYLVTLSIKRLTLGCGSSVSKVIDLTKTVCPVTFNYDFSNSPSFDTTHYSEVLVEYTSKSGDYYRSDIITQEVPQFIIDEVMPYENNEKNDKTVRFKLNFTCDLMNENGQRIKLKGMEGRVGVSYP